MTTPTTDSRDTLCEAAGLLLAEATGDTTASRLLIDAMLEERNLGAALLLLRAVLDAAGPAVRAECQRAAESGEDSTPSVDYLTALMKHARTATQ